MIVSALSTTTTGLIFAPEGNLCRVPGYRAIEMRCEALAGEPIWRQSMAQAS
jgi:hypothetical protein